MPIYEYRCRQCGEQFEKIQKFSDPVLTKCENCGGMLERLLSPPAIQFKGSGWYVTDYARKSDSSKSSTETATTGGTEKKESGGGQPASTAQSKSSPEK